MLIFVFPNSTMIEPTREFGNEFLNIMASALKLPYGDKEFNLIRDLYLKRQEFKGRAEVLSQLDAVNEALNNLEPEKAAKIFNSIKV